ncbi:MAG: helicase C-terminal domain-containing protein, partial [Pseudomonadota bacterium]|nr:helicase C-terminal domain-containing protein [Pseudomonadota bacterium]
DKRAALRGLLDSEDVKNALIFCNRKRDIGVLQRSLVRHGYNAVSLHGDMSQPARLETLEKFKNDEADLMVASDVAARGLDIKGLSHVFNFDVPSNPEDYVHRIGRTGRAGSEGRALTLATPEDARYLANIVKLIGGEIPPFQVAGVDSSADPAPAPKTRGRRAKSEGEKSPETSLETKPESGKTSGKRGHGSERKRGAERGRNGERTPAPLPDDGGTVIGFGSEMPAFMRNPVNVSNK